jgi:hypothetical protein
MLQTVPQLVLSNWIKANYNLTEIPTGDITWNQWWDDQYDIVIDFEELNSPISAATIDSSVDLLESQIRIHIFVRDLNVHADASPLGDMLDMPFADVDFEINVPSQMGLLVQYLNKLIDQNPLGMRSQGIMTAEVLDGFEVPNANWDDNVYHWIIQVQMIYTEYS